MSRRIPFLSIDVEGFDYTVTKAASRTYLEFEYHVQGDWGRQKLEDQTLAQTGFVCYWAGIQKLWRITGCWQPQFEFNQWSNVACAAP